MASVSIEAHHRMTAISPSRDSMTYTSTKGLLNAPGQNNCFLNSAVQVLWHLDIFRRSFRDLSGHACMAESCIFCALKELFSQLQFSNETALPPDALRRALAESFFDQQRFQLGFMDDAAECFENMLLRIHMHIAHGEAEDMCNAKHCIPHQKFAMTLVEQSVCGACGATSEPLPFTQMVHYISASALTAQARRISNSGPHHTQCDSFGQLLKKAGGMGDIRDCPSACGAKIQIRRTLMNRPEIVSVGVVWDSERPTLEHIMDVFATVGTSLRLGDVFHNVVDNRWSDLTIHNLVGVVTYYGKHYSTFFFHSKLRVWIYFDDATVREVGPRWDQVVEKCRRGRYQPLLLLYAVPSGTPVNTENAPKHVTPFYTDKSLKMNSHSMLRRSVTPSPEKPNVGSTRRAITPNPDGSFSQKPPLPRPYNEYQNLSVIQDNLYGKHVNNGGVDVVDGDIGKHHEYVTRNGMMGLQPAKLQHVQVHRTLSNGSSSGMEGINVPEHLNVPRRRDSGNWSGDRNSASSSSSTTMENPYSYLVGKMPHNGGSVPSSPTRVKGDCSSGSSGIYDAGYDSYSLSSNDSSAVTTVHHLMKQGHLAQIPEDYGHVPIQQLAISCDSLCKEADELLIKSRQLEDEHDLVLALALCNAAATKARAAMNAPYNNPQTLTSARMKHNTCVMRARSLHRRITQTQTPTPKDSIPEIRHTREGSSGSGRHSRQSSRDKGQHSRQNSKELLMPPPQPKVVQQTTKNIEIYATLPKKKGSLKNKINNIDIGEDHEYILYEKSPIRESRSLLSRSKSKEEIKLRDKRSRSEDRNKISQDFSIISVPLSNAKDTLKRDKGKEEQDDKKEKEGKAGKKQHKIRRKLLMGGLIRRKNRSMPDLTEGNKTESPDKNEKILSVDDSGVGLKGNDNVASMCGYLSEGHLEFTGNGTNPNLERSRLMRKSFHGSAGKVLAVAKVPPPPPLRTTSQLTISKANDVENNDKNGRPMYPLPIEINNSNYGYNNTNYGNHIDTIATNRNMVNRSEPVSLPYLPSHGMKPTYNYYNQQGIIKNNQNITIGGMIYQNQDSNANKYMHMVITQADVHQEQSPIKPTQLSSPYNHQIDDGVDEVDCVPLKSTVQNLDLPPYPSPMGSIVHSRQASEEFPPPPPPLDLSSLEEHLRNESYSPTPPPVPGSLLAELQNKRQQIMCQEFENKKYSTEVNRSSGDTWLRELQAKQEALRMKKHATFESQNLIKRDMETEALNAPKLSDFQHSSFALARKVSTDSLKSDSSKVTSVKDLASKFENIQVQPVPANNNRTPSPSSQKYLSPVMSNENNKILMYDHNLGMHTAAVSKENKLENSGNTGVLSLKKRDDKDTIDPQQIASEIREVELLNEVVHKTLHNEKSEAIKRNRPGKKKSVSFCDQVILVATAEEQEEDSFIPNPILERVLRTALSKSDGEQEVSQMTENEKVTELHVISAENNAIPQHEKHLEPYTTPTANPSQVVYDQQPLYVRRGSIDNLLSHQKTFEVADKHYFPGNYALPNQPQNVNNSQTMPYYMCNEQQTPTPPINEQMQQYKSQPSPAALYNQQQNSQIYQSKTQQKNPAQLIYPPYEENQPNSQYMCTSKINGNPNGICGPNQQIRHSPNPQQWINNYTNNQYTSQTVQQPPYQQSPHQVYQHPPSLLPPSNHMVYNNNLINRSMPAKQNYMREQQPIPQSPYQRVPHPFDYPSSNNQIPNQYEMHQVQPNPAVYQRVPQSDFQQMPQNNTVYQRLPSNSPAAMNHHHSQFTNNNSPYQTIPRTEQNSPYQQVPRTEQNYPYQSVPNQVIHDISYHESPPYQSPPIKYSPYQHVMPSKQQFIKKNVSFEAGTKGGSESPTPKAIVTPIVVNSSVNVANKNVNSKIKCNLCRKKYVLSPSLYCTDCDFYMSRFKPKS